MTATQSANQVSRDTILKLLSDEEIARVSNAETAKSLADGQEYIDLQELGRGVQHATSSTKGVMGHMLPRSAVHSETWTKVVALFDSVRK